MCIFTYICSLLQGTSRYLQSHFQTLYPIKEKAFSNDCFGIMFIDRKTSQCTTFFESTTAHIFLDVGILQKLTVRKTTAIDAPLCIYLPRLTDERNRWIPRTL